MSTIAPLLAAIPPTIGDLASEVILRCENRQQDINRAYVWVRDSLIEITSHTDYRDDFDELEIWGVPFVLTPGLSEYPFSGLLPNAVDPVTLVPVPSLNMATLDVLIWTDPPTNSNFDQLTTTHYQLVDRGSSRSKGQPASWYRFGDSIGFFPNPSKGYQVQARILRMHPINDVALQNTAILINRDWHEVIIWGAVERGYMELLEFDKAQSVHTLLHGDPKYPAKIGLLQGAKKRRKREAWRQTSALRFYFRPYGYGRY